MKNTSLKALAAVLEVSLEEDFQISDYQIDSRNISENSLFFALPGQRRDGHEFLHEVRSRGGKAAVVLGGYLGPSFGLTLLRVGDVVGALYKLARYFLDRGRAKIFAVTGSVGKTTTKDFVATLLQGKFSLHAAAMSFNTKLTVPLTLLNRRGDEEVLVLEMGSSAPGDIEHLVDLVAPDVSLITKVSLAHAAFFPEGLVQIAEEKGTIFSDLQTKQVIFPHSFLQFSHVMEKIDPKKERISFSLEERTADYFLKVEGTRGAIDERGVRAFEFDLPFFSTQNLENLLAAFSAARAFQMSWEEIERQLPHLKAPKMRFEVVEMGGATFINDAYNASPASLEAALKNLPSPKEGGKTIAVLGEMRELGAFSTNAHLEMGKLAVKVCDILFSLGKEALSFHPPFEEAEKRRAHFETLKELILALRSVIRPGDVVLVKGSRALEMEKIFLEI